MHKAKRHLSFIHRFIPPKNGRSEEKSIQGKAFTTFLLLHGTGGNEQDLIPLAYELDKSAAYLVPEEKC